MSLHLQGQEKEGESTSLLLLSDALIKRFNGEREKGRKGEEVREGE